MNDDFYERRANLFHKALCDILVANAEQDTIKIQQIIFEAWDASYEIRHDTKE
jgi:hypothetical protein